MLSDRGFPQRLTVLCTSLACFPPPLHNAPNDSATTVLVLTLGSGVDGFTLDPDQGKFLHTHRDIRIPSSGPIYSFNEANFRDFDQPVRRYLTALKEGSSRVGTRYVFFVFACVPQFGSW